MILEGVVTTVDAKGTLNVAPMGPRVDSGFDRFVLRPYNTSTTYRNLIDAREGVLHVTDDVLLIARASVGKLGDIPTRPASAVQGHILGDACRFYEFRIIAVDHSTERAEFVAETVASGRIRDFFGFNRAKHAVIEAAILATRLEFLPPESILGDLEKLAVIVGKTAGPSETEAFELIHSFVVEHISARDKTSSPRQPR